MARYPHQRLALAATVGFLATCAQPRPEPPPLTSSTAAIDGSYSGTANGSCGAFQPARMDLRDGRFTLTVATGLELRGRAEASGTLSAAEVTADGREVNFSGQIDGKMMRGGSYNGRCAFAFAMTRTS